MFGFQKYNYDTFNREMVLKDMAAGRTAGGPEPGERAPDFEARTLEGDKNRLSDFRGHKNVVLTFGSVTCPMTAGSIRGMNELYDEYSGDDVQFLFVYVREAHPGDEAPAHELLEHKVRAAERLRDEEEIEMPILVDDLRGSIHRKYGKLPNSTYIIDKSGRVAFRALWTRPRVVEDALEALLERQRDRGVEHAVVNGGEDRSMPMTYPILYAHRALERGGPKAMADFRRAMGVPGRMALVASRVAQPLAMHPGKALAAAALAGGVIAAGIYAGSKLRQRRFALREPYRVHEFAERRAATGTDDYEPVGI
jgi:peroxiredoxin